MTQIKVITIDDPNLWLVPRHVAIQPLAGIIECLKNQWWVCHPNGMLVFYRDADDFIPQCNGNEAMARKIASVMYPWAEVHQIPLVFRKVNLNTMRRQSMPLFNAIPTSLKPN